MNAVASRFAVLPSAGRTLSPTPDPARPPAAPPAPAAVASPAAVAAPPAGRAQAALGSADQCGRMPPRRRAPAPAQRRLQPHNRNACRPPCFPPRLQQLQLLWGRPEPALWRCSRSRGPNPRTHPPKPRPKPPRPSKVPRGGSRPAPGPSAILGLVRVLPAALEQQPRRRQRAPPRQHD